MGACLQLCVGEFACFDGGVRMRQVLGRGSARTFPKEEFTTMVVKQTGWRGAFPCGEAGGRLVPSWDEREGRIHPAPCSWCPPTLGGHGRGTTRWPGSPWGPWGALGPAQPCLLQAGAFLPSSSAPGWEQGLGRGVLAGAVWGRDCSCAPD